MTVAEFRSTPELVKAMRELLESPALKLWWEAMEESENPANFAVKDDVTPHFAHIMLGQQTGYGMFKQRFLLGGRGIEAPAREPEQDYSKSREEIEEELAMEQQNHGN